MTKATNAGAPEFDDQTIRARPPGLGRKTLEIIGLHSKVLESDLKEVETSMNKVARDKAITPNYSNGELVSFTLKGKEKTPEKKVKIRKLGEVTIRKEHNMDTIENLYIIHKFTRESATNQDQRDHYCIVQEAKGDKHCGLVRLKDAQNDKREPVIEDSFTQDYRLIPGGIEYQTTKDSKRIIRDDLRSNQD